MTTDRFAVLLNEVRYAERLCQRTARLYRRLQTFGTFATVIAGSAAVSSAWHIAPPWVSVTGAVAFAVCGAALLAVRPADKAAANEADVKRYAKLRAESSSMDEAGLQMALNKAREGDTAEVEPLRDVAFNDVLAEVGRLDGQIALNWRQRLLSALA